jgi:hypothetical protein
VSRIVVTTIGSLGDLHPIIAIALELRQRGHDIVFATIKDYRAKIEALGFEFHALRPDRISPEDPEMMALIMDLQKGPERVIKDYLLANVRETYTDLTNAAQDADFIVTAELVYAARPDCREVRHSVGILCASAHLHFSQLTIHPFYLLFRCWQSCACLGME